MLLDRFHEKNKIAGLVEKSMIVLGIYQFIDNGLTSYSSGKDGNKVQIKCKVWQGKNKNTKLLFLSSLY